jgi:glycosyltransferase involved in cell wall biosynthesis
MKNYKISFIIPAYNEESVLAQCLVSLKEEIDRYAYTTEILVVNNASTDRTKEIAESFKGVHVVDELKKGLVWARQCGMDNSTGELIANIDADVLIPKDWLKKVMDEFNNDEKLVALSGPYIYYDISIWQGVFVRVFYYLGYLFYFINDRILRVSGMLQGGNYIVRRTSLEKIGGYDTTISFYGEDTDIAKRIHAVGKVKWTFALPMYTTGRRLLEEGIVTMGIKYAVNHIWPIFFGRPFTQKYKDIRV